MDVVHIIALTMGVAWASGINLYATVFMLGLLANTGHIVLPEQLVVVTDPLVMFAAALMYCIEFFADKIPGVDSGWDAIHTFIRIPAGAVLAMGAISELGPAAELAALLLGGTLTASVHATKAGSRVLINTSPEPFSNWATSLGEDVIAIGGLWLALTNPWLFLFLLLFFIALMFWLIPRIWRGISALIRTLRNLFQRPAPAMAESPPALSRPSDNNSGVPP